MKVKMTEKQYGIIQRLRNSEKRTQEQQEKELARYFANNWFDRGAKVNLTQLVLVFMDAAEVEIVADTAEEA